MLKECSISEQTCPPFLLELNHEAVRSHSSPGFVAQASTRQNEKPVVQHGRTDFLCGTEGLGPMCRPGSPAPSSGLGWPKTRLGHEAGSSASCLPGGAGGLGRVCCSRLAGRRQKPEQAEGVQLVNAIYTMYKLLSVRSAVLTRSRRLREKGTSGEGQARPTPSWHSRGKGEEVPMAPPDTKNVENSLNNGTKLRLSPEVLRGLGLGRDAVQSLQRLGH